MRASKERHSLLLDVREALSLSRHTPRVSITNKHKNSSTRMKKVHDIDCVGARPSLPRFLIFSLYSLDGSQCDDGGYSLGR